MLFTAKERRSSNSFLSCMQSCAHELIHAREGARSLGLDLRSCTVADAGLARGRHCAGAQVVQPVEAQAPATCISTCTQSGVPGQGNSSNWKGERGACAPAPLSQAQAQTQARCTCQQHQIAPHAAC